MSLSGLVVILVPRFADLMALIGATCCTLLAFILPALCHMVIFKSDLTSQQYAIDILLVILGIWGAIVGTGDAVKKVLRS